MPSFTSVLSAIFIAYVAHSVYSIASLFVAPTCQQGSLCFEPELHGSKSSGEIVILYSDRRQPSTISDLKLIDHWEDVDLSSVFEKSINFTVPRSLKRNSTCFLHVFLSLRKRKDKSNWAEVLQDEKVSHAVTYFTQYQIPEAEAFSLLGQQNDTTQDKPTKSTNELHGVPVTHLRSKVQLNVLHHPYALPRNEIPQEVASLLTITKDGKFMPPVFIDPLSFRIKDLVKVDKSVDEIPVHFSYSPISFGKLRVWLQFSGAIEQMKKFGFTEKDVDEVKGIFSDTNIYFLCLTFVVSGFHMLFDILAFKNDISFWRQKKSMIGLSVRTVLWRAFSQTVIFLYLLAEDTSLLVTIPSGIACLIDYWKVTKALKIDFQFSGCLVPRMTVGKFSKEEQETDDFDADFLKKLSYVLCPLVIAGAVYSLIYMPHKSWYSWTLQSLVNGVYAFGFLFMLPQLFVNYKLKSVAHLPWKAFMYKAFNTFIDDIFSFIITMPTSHRLACFRDDVVFVVYLYQKWLYPVDKKRVNEFGGTGEENEEEKKEK